MPKTRKYTLKINDKFDLDMLKTVYPMVSQNKFMKDFICNQNPFLHSEGVLNIKDKDLSFEVEVEKNRRLACQSKIEILGPDENSKYAVSVIIHDGRRTLKLFENWRGPIKPKNITLSKTKRIFLRVDQVENISTESFSYKGTLVPDLDLEDQNCLETDMKFFDKVYRTKRANKEVD